MVLSNQRALLARLRCSDQMLLRVRDGDFGISVVNDIYQKDRYPLDCLYSRLPIDAFVGERSYTFGASLIQVEGLRQCSCISCRNTSAFDKYIVADTQY